MNLLTFAFVASLVLVVSGCTEAQTPADGVPLLPENALDAARKSLGNDPSVARFEMAEVAGQPFSKALRAITAQRPKQTFDVLVALQPTGAVRKDEVCLLSFWARGPASEDESGDARINAYFQQNHPPYRKVVSARVSVNREWQHGCPLT